MTGIDTTFLIDLEIKESPRHERAVEIFNKWREEKNSFLVIYSNVFNEFLHVITDAKRFVNPVPMETAIERCWYWIDHQRVKVVYSSDDSLKRLLLWMSMHELGRKRINDTSPPDTPYRPSPRAKAPPPGRKSGASCHSP